MISWATTLGQLRDEVDRYIRLLGKDAPVGTTHQYQKSFENTLPDNSKIPCPPGEYLDMVQLELVYINTTGQVVGDEANDYRLKSGELKAVKVS